MRGSLLGCEHSEDHDLCTAKVVTIDDRELLRRPIQRFLIEA
jgi:hypothetical protein